MFIGPQGLPLNALIKNALIKMVFEVPEATSGQKNSDVLCQGRVLRAQDTPELEAAKIGLAASIVGYKFSFTRLFERRAAR